MGKRLFTALLACSWMIHLGSVGLFSLVYLSFQFVICGDSKCSLDKDTTNCGVVRNDLTKAQNSQILLEC